MNRCARVTGARRIIVRCDKCQAEAVEPALFCEQCGQELTTQETRSLDASEATGEQFAFDFSGTSSGRCGSCGGPSPDGDLCPVCLQAFSSVLSTPAAAVVDTSAPAHVDLAATSEPKLYPVPELVALCDSPASVDEFPVLQAALAAHDVPDVAAVGDSRVNDVHVPVAETPAVVVADVPAVVADSAAVVVENVPAVVAENLPAVAAESVPVVPEPVQASTEPQAAVVVAMPVAAEKVPAAVVQAPRRNRAEVVAAAAVLIVAAVGVPAGARWLQNQAAQRARGPQVTEQPAPAPAKPAPVARAVVPPAPVQAEAQPAAVEVAVKPAAAPVAPAVRPAAAAAVQTKQPVNARQVRPAAKTKTAAPVPAATAVAAAPAPAPPPIPEPAPAPQQPVVTAQVAPAPEAPSGKLFDPSDVDETPRISGRVAPQLPGNLPRTANDVVVVRILVSQSGHAFRVNLLRRSRLGPAADEAVVAAVRQWTFSPARKRGEAVSCWLNVGVSLAGN
jgi:protein TonB